MLKDFYNRFGLKTSLAGAENRFMKRVDVTVFTHYTLHTSYTESLQLGANFLRWLSKEIGEDFNRFTNITNYNRYDVSRNFNWQVLVQDNITRYLLIIEYIYKYVSLFCDNNQISYLNKTILDLLDRAEIDLGFFWKDGKFYPAGSKFLDKELVEEALDWLKDFPEEKTDFQNALKAHLEKRNNDAIGDCYNCVEGITRKILKNTKVLDNNKEELVTKLGFSQEWKSLVINFIKYANEYKRHASNTRHKANPDEVEAFLYMTGLITRMCLKKE